jgi:hypothetical protein
MSDWRMTKDDWSTESVADLRGSKGDVLPQLPVSLMTGRSAKRTENDECQRSPDGVTTCLIKNALALQLEHDRRVDVVVVVGLIVSKGIYR